jgi:homoaconitase/3-isopropylmalate dehydratase large subunit
MVEGYTDKIIQKHSDGRREGEYYAVDVDFVLLPDPTFALLLSELKDLGGRIWS